MKRLFFVAAAIMAAVVSTRAEDKPEDWYKPTTWSGGAQGSATVYYKDGRTVEDYTVTMDSDGKVNEDDWAIIVNAHAQDPSMLTALSALRKALESQVQIAYMGQRLNDLIGSKGITVKGKDPNGNEYTYTISLQKTTGGQFSKDGDGNIQGNTDASLSNYADGKTIEWATGGKAHLQLYGKPANAAAGEGKLPMFNGDSLTWVGLKPYFDDKSLEAKTVSNAKIEDGGIQLRGWDTHNLGSDFKLGDVLTGDNEDTSSQVLVYNGGYLQYWHLGKLSSGGSVRVDGASIVTNETSDGSVSIKGFADAGLEQLPYTDGENIKWTDGGGTDGSLLARGAAIPGSIGWTSTQGNSRYYGTGGNGEPLGWHNLPNVTTNYVEADEVSLTAVVDGDKKTLKIKEIGTDAVYGRSGDAWVPIQGTITNDFRVSVDGVSIDTNATGNALQIVGWKDHQGGFVMHGDNNNVAHKTVFADEDLGGLEFDENANDFGFHLEKWWDGYAGTCSENLGGVLTGQIAESADSHLILARKDDGSMHYMRIGRVPNVSADEVTITTNGMGAAAGKLSIVGAYDTGNTGKVLSSTGAGVAWIAAGGSTEIDNVTISTNETGHVGQLSIKGAFSPENYGKLFKVGESGGIEFVETDVIEVVTDVNYDPQTHQFTKTKRFIEVVYYDDEGEDETVFTARARSDR